MCDLKNWNENVVPKSMGDCKICGNERTASTSDIFLDDFYND